MKLCVCLFCDASFKKKNKFMREMGHGVQKWNGKKIVCMCLEYMSKRTLEESVICLTISHCEIMNEIIRQGDMI